MTVELEDVRHRGPDRQQRGARGHVGLDVRGRSRVRPERRRNRPGTSPATTGRRPRSVGTASVASSASASAGRTRPAEIRAACAPPPVPATRQAVGGEHRDHWSEWQQVLESLHGPQLEEGERHADPARRQGSRATSSDGRAHARCMLRAARAQTASPIELGYGRDVEERGCGSAGGRAARPGSCLRVPPVRRARAPAGTAAIVIAITASEIRIARRRDADLGREREERVDGAAEDHARLLREHRETHGRPGAAEPHRPARAGEADQEAERDGQ